MSEAFEACDSFDPFETAKRLHTDIVAALNGQGPMVSETEVARLMAAAVFGREFGTHDIDRATGQRLVKLVSVHRDVISGKIPRPPTGILAKNPF